MNGCRCSKSQAASGMVVIIVADDRPPLQY
jgi:hypothetical protein